MTRSAAAAPARADIYLHVTSHIIADLENGVRPWLKPWSTGNAAEPITKPLRGNGQPYKGINVVMLWGEAIAKGYTSPTWLTYRQAAEHGGQVRKGEHGSLVVYADRICKTDTDDNGEEIEREIPFLRGYTMFNAEQIDGLPDRFYAAPSPSRPTFERIAGAEHFVRNTAIDIRHGGDRAFYAIDADRVQLPPLESFSDAEAYYATLLHEIVHNAVIGIMPRLGIPLAWRANSAGSAEPAPAPEPGATRAMPPRRWWPRSARPFCAPISELPRNRARTTRAILPRGSRC